MATTLFDLIHKLTKEKIYVVFKPVFGDKVAIEINTLHNDKLYRHETALHNHEHLPENSMQATCEIIEKMYHELKQSIK